MKICLISNLFPPFVRGGAERVAEIMARGLFESGNNVAIISTKPSAGLAVEETERYRIYRFKPMNLFYYLDDFHHSFLKRFFWRIFDIFNFHSAAVVARILHIERPDFVITHNLTGIGSFIPSVIRAFKINHCHILHDVQLSAPSGIILKGGENSFLTNSWLARAYEFICRIMFGSPELVISPSRWLMNFYVNKGFFQESIKIVQANPVKITNFTGGEKSVKHNTFLFIGQIQPHKGIDWLLNVWEKNKIESELVVIGQGDCQVKYDKIKYVGALNETELNKFFVQADFLIVPSLCYENSPTVIQIALANGVPVIVADIGGAAELVENDKSGFVFEAGSEIAFLKVLSQAKALSLEDWLLMSNYCKEKAAGFFVDVYIQQLEELIGKLLTKK